MSKSDLEKTSFKELRNKAYDGDSNAQFWLGCLYSGGCCVPRSKINAFMWWHIASANENKDAKKMLVGSDDGEFMSIPDMLIQFRAQEKAATLVEKNPNLINFQNVMISGKFESDPPKCDIFLTDAEGRVLQ